MAIRSAACTATALATLGLVAISPASAAPTGGFVEYPDQLHAPCEGVYQQSSGRIFVEEIVNPSETSNIGAIGVLDPATGTGQSSVTRSRCPEQPLAAPR